MSAESATPDLVANSRHGFEAMNRRDSEAMMRFWAEDVCFESRALGVSFIGRAAVRQFADEWLGSFEELAFEVEELLDLGGGVTLAVVRQIARPFGAAESIEQRDAWVSEWARERVTRVTAYLDIDEARTDAKRLAKERE